MTVGDRLIANTNDIKRGIWCPTCKGWTAWRCPFTQVQPDGSLVSMDEIDGCTVCDADPLTN